MSTDGKRFTANIGEIRLGESFESVALGSPHGINVGTRTGDFRVFFKDADVPCLHEALGAYLKAAYACEVTTSSADLERAPALNYTEKTVIYRGSGTDMATDLRAIMARDKLQAMADSLVDTGHVRLTSLLPTGDVASFAEAKNAFSAKVARLDCVEQAAMHLLQTMDQHIPPLAMPFGVAREISEKAETLRSLVIQQPKGT